MYVPVSDLKTSSQDTLSVLTSVTYVPWGCAGRASCTAFPVCSPFSKSEKSKFRTSWKLLMEAKRLPPRWNESCPPSVPRTVPAVITSCRNYLLNCLFFPLSWTPPRAKTVCHSSSVSGVRHICSWCQAQRNPINIWWMNERMDGWIQSSL